MGKYADALYLMQRIASETKDDRIGKSAELHIARLHERMGDTDKAIEQYRRIARNYGVDRHQEARYLHQIASIQARVGNQAAQLGTLHEILDRSEDVKEILNVRVRIAEAYLKTGNVKDAVAQYRHIRDNHSLDDPSELPNRLLYYIGGQFGWRITSDRQRQYPNLSESLKKAIDTRIARYFRVDGNFDAAIKQYERIQSNYHMSDAENVELWRNLGASYAGKGDYTRAIAEYRKIVEVGKTNSNDMLIDNGLEGIANLERKRGGWERMMQVLEAEVAQMQVPCVKVLLWMKKEYSEQGRHEKLQEMMIKHPDMFPPSRFEVLEGLCLIGQRQFLIGNYEQARSVLQEVINEGPPHQYAAMISSSYVGYLNEGGLEILQKGQKMINSKRYRDAAFFYKEIVDHIQEGNNHLHIKYYGDMLRRHGVFESVFSEYLDIMSSGQHQS